MSQRGAEAQKQAFIDLSRTKCEMCLQKRAFKALNKRARIKNHMTNIHKTKCKLREQNSILFVQVLEKSKDTKNKLCSLQEQNNNLYTEYKRDFFTCPASSSLPTPPPLSSPDSASCTSHVHPACIYSGPIFPNFVA